MATPYLYANAVGGLEPSQCRHRVRVQLHVGADRELYEALTEIMQGGNGTE